MTVTYRLLTIILCASMLSACAYHERYTMWYDREERRRSPVRDPRVEQSGEFSGQCVQDWEVTYVEKGQIRERTKRLGSNYTAAGVLGLASIFSYVMWANSYTDGASGFWALSFLATGLGALGWGTYTLILDVTEAAPTETEREIVETETLKSDGCDREQRVASGGDARDPDCMKGELVTRKLEQLEELREEGLIDQAEYDDERERLVATRCPDNAASAADDPRARLKKLDQLHNEGLISDEEYDRKRNEILDRL